MVKEVNKDGDNTPTLLVGDPVLFAELRRMTMDIPSTATLPDQIPLQVPGDFVALSFGRHQRNIVQLDCQHVPSLLSKFHSDIKIDTNGVHSLTDLNTLNGTYLNGNLIPTEQPHPLHDGDVITFGGPKRVSYSRVILLFPNLFRNN